jgi:hypothetical protein
LHLPTWCKCGNIVTFSNEDRCENCYSTDQVRYHGKSLRVKTTSWPERERECNVKHPPSPTAR